MDTPDTARIRVLLGAAGTGKSAIAHTIAHRFDELKQLGSCFCFSTSESSRTPDSLFRNIARDLCAIQPAFKAALSLSVGDNISLSTTDDLTRQFEEFILRPANRLLLSGTVIIIIDALDESGDIKTRADLLQLLAERLKDLPSAFRVLITARAELDIEQTFSKCDHDIYVQYMPTLAEDDSLSVDISKYIHNTLKAAAGLPEEACQDLTEKAEGLFQWAFVACHYITDEQIGSNASTRYHVIVHEEDASYVDPLDNLYLKVLSNLFKEEQHIQPFKAIMGLVLTTVEPLCMESIRMLLAMSGELLDANVFLPHLGSLMSGVQERKAAVRPLHSSFTELLQSAERGKRFHIGALGHHERLTTAMLQLLQKELHFNMGGLQSSYQLTQNLPHLKSRISEVLLYSCQHWGHHLSKCQKGFEHDLAELLTYFFKKAFLFWLDAASIAEIVNSASSCLVSAKEYLQVCL